MRTLLAAAGMMLVTGMVAAQTYPTRPITLVVTTSAGTTPDVLARHMAPVLSQRLGQPVIVDNRAGASGNIGAAQVAKAAPDGHTLMMTALLFSMTPAFNKDLPFDPAADFEPIGTVGKATLALVAHPRIRPHRSRTISHLPKVDLDNRTSARPASARRITSYLSCSTARRKSISCMSPIKGQRAWSRAYWVARSARRSFRS